MTLARNWKPLTPETWNDFETLFGPRGACGGCWCMTWRVSRADFKSNGGAGNRLAMRALVDAGREPGVLLYEDGRAVAWCAVAPREEYVRLGASRVWAPVDEQKVWSVSCFFVDKKARNKGLSVAVLKAAVEFARSKGAKIVEGYPQELKERLPPAFVFMGVMPTFVHAGFSEVTRRSPTKPIMRSVVRKTNADGKTAAKKEWGEDVKLARKKDKLTKDDALKSTMFRDMLREVSRVPRGKVATYGDIAYAAGYPGAARQVAWALHAESAGLPWHRIVGAGGTILLTGEHGFEQRLHLQAEGVSFLGLKVNMAAHHHGFDLRKAAETLAKKPAKSSVRRKIGPQR